MVKDEDVCLHCGLCAERCPTGAWDMQKFLLEMAHGRSRACRTSMRRARQRLRRQVRQRQRLRARRAPTSCSPSRSCAWACRSAPRNIFPSNIQGLPTWYEVRVSRGGLSRPARRRRPDGRDEPADLGQGRRRDRARRLPVLRLHQADAGVEVPRRHHRHRHAADRDLQPRRTPIRASASCSRTSSMSARSPRCSTSMSTDDRAADRRAVQGQGQADRAQHPGAAHGPRLRARRTCDCPSGCGSSAATRSATASSSTATAPRRSAASTAARRSRAWYPITPSTSLAEAFTSYCRKFRIDPETGKNRSPSSRPRTSSPRSAW